MCSLNFLSLRFITYCSSFILGKAILEKAPLNTSSKLKDLVVSILLKGWSGTKKILLYSLPALLLVMHFTTDKIIGCTNEAAQGANTAPRNPRFCYFSFHVLLFP